MQKFALPCLVLCFVTHATNEIEKKVKEVPSERLQSFARSLSKEERELFDATGEPEGAIVKSMASLALAEREAREAERRQRDDLRSYEKS